VNIPVTEMTPADYDDVLALWQCTENVGLSDADSRENVRAYFVRNPGLSLVARHDGRLVGAVLCGHDGRRGYLHHLAVAPEYRRGGIGTRLVETCLSLLARVGIPKVNIFLFRDNDAGRRFWLRKGWTERGELDVLSKETAGAISHQANGPALRRRE
jgi:N-acetylglutamate synthase